MRKTLARRRASALCLLLSATVASGTILLSNFELITGFVPVDCIFAYNTPIDGCGFEDFIRGNPCSRSCIRDLDSVEVNIRRKCSAVEAQVGSLLAKAQKGGLVQALCEDESLKTTTMTVTVMPSTTSRPPPPPPATRTSFPSTTIRPPVTSTSKRLTSTTTRLATTTSSAISSISLPSTTQEGISTTRDEPSTTQRESSTTQDESSITREPSTTASQDTTTIATFPTITDIPPSEIASLWPTSTKTDNEGSPTTNEKENTATRIPGSGGGSPADFISPASRVEFSSWLRMLILLPFAVLILW